MSSTQNTAYLEVDHDFRIEPIHAGGFLITQSYYLPGRTDEEGSKEQYVQFKKAFSTPGDMLDYLQETFNYPQRRLREVPPAAKLDLT